MLLTATRVLIDGAPRAGVGIAIGMNGRIQQVGELSRMGRPDRVLEGRVLSPGLVNAHSHAFQRLLRGRTQVPGRTDDDFWTWRQVMYAVADRLDPESMYVAARQAFIEMLLAGVTCVGEFHYVHHAPGGVRYDDPAVMAEAVARAALDAGIRLCLLRTVYLQGDFGRPPAPHQLRFCDATLDDAWEHIEAVIGRLRSMLDPRVSWGLAAHSLRGVPIDAIVGIKTCAGHLPFHVHASEQPLEVESSIRHLGAPPIEVLASRGVLDAMTTVIHATHLRAGEVERLAQSGAGVCVCPSTEADLGDGLGPVGQMFRAGVPLSLGTDGQTASSILLEAKRLEMHERLRIGRRNVLGTPERPPAHTVWSAATVNGGRALDLACGRIAPGYWGDLVAFDLADPHLAGWDDASLLALLAFSADTRAVTDVMVGGRWVVEDREHPLGEVSAADMAAACRRMFAEP